MPPSWSAASQLANLIKLRPYPPVGTLEICRDVCPVVAIGGEADMGWTAHSVAIDPEQTSNVRTCRRSLTTWKKVQHNSPDNPLLIRYYAVRGPSKRGSDAIRSTKSARVHHAARRGGGRMAAAGRAQQAERMRRIGWLSTGNPTSHRISLAAFRDGLTALDYVEGRNITIEYRWADGNVDRLPRLADELAQQKVDIILAGGSLGAQAAKRSTSSSQL